MKQDQFRLSLVSNRAVWSLGSLVFFVSILLMLFFAQAGSLFGQNQPEAIESVNGGNTAVIFPTNQIATLTQHTESAITAIVPEKASNGSVFVSTTTGSSNNAPFSIGSSFIPNDSSETNSWTTTFSGNINVDTQWQSNILLTGDVTVTQGITLTIDPGVTVFFTANNDDQASGNWNNKPEIQVFGTIIAEGSENEPIRFTSDATNKSIGDWGAITIHKESTDASFANCVIHFAEQGLNFSVVEDGTITGSITNCAINTNRTGLHFDANPTGDINNNAGITTTIKNSEISGNSQYGIFIGSQNEIISGKAHHYQIFENNVIANNDVGIIITETHSVAGFGDIYPQIRNNRIEDNLSHGFMIYSEETSDDNPARFEFHPIVENNLFQNNPNNIYLFLFVRGPGGRQTLNPIIQYNTIRNAQNGILLEETSTWEVFDPEIHHNIFYSHTNRAINNFTSRTIQAEQNYWGNSSTAWDAGATVSDTFGTVIASNHLTTASTPILTHTAPNPARSTQVMKLFGANFGESQISNLFLPMIINNQETANFDPILIGNAIPTRNVETHREVFYTTTIQVPTVIPSNGNFYLSSQPNSLAPVLVDDEIIMKVNDSIIFTHDFSAGGIPQYATLSISRATIAQMAGQTVTVQYLDIYGNVVTASEMWFIWVP